PLIRNSALEENEARGTLFRPWRRVPLSRFFLFFFTFLQPWLPVFEFLRYVLRTKPLLLVLYGSTNAVLVHHFALQVPVALVIHATAIISSERKADAVLLASACRGAGMCLRSCIYIFPPRSSFSSAISV